MRPRKEGEILPSERRPLVEPHLCPNQKSDYSIRPATTMVYLEESEEEDVSANTLSSSPETILSNLPQLLPMR